MSLKVLEEALDFNQNYVKKTEEASDFIRNELNNSVPVFGITLGSGLGEIADSIKNSKIIPYKEIPNFPTTTVEGHKGELIIGELNEVPILGLKGRKHFYEVGHEPFNNGLLKCVFPVHVLANLGIKNYFVTNAAGGLNLNYEVGDVMIINSHINLIPNALLGNHYDFKNLNGERVWRFQPMNGEYDPELQELLFSANKDFINNMHEGFYLAVTGPTYETRAECLAFRRLGADAVGMSTAPEVIVARNRGMNVVGFSCITNTIDEQGNNDTNHEEVKAILESKEVKDRITTIVKNFFELYKQNYIKS